MAMKTSFGCVSLQTGSLIIGWFSLLWNIFGVLVFYFLETRHSSDADHQIKAFVHSNITTTVIDLTFTALVIFSFVSLIHGAYKERHGFLLPYLLVTFTTVGYHTVVFAYTFIVVMVYNDVIIHFPGKILLLDFVSLAIITYFFCVVYSYYKELKTIAAKLNCPA